LLRQQHLAQEVVGVHDGAVHRLQLGPARGRDFEAGNLAQRIGARDVRRRAEAQCFDCIQALARVSD